jgi:trehalose utilization protein
MPAASPIRITVWGEYRHEKRNPKVAEIYPRGMHEAIGDALRKNKDFQVTTAHLDQEEHGLTEARLRDTDVLTWWGHLHHADLTDLIAERVYARVMAGMGLVVLHSGHFSKIFKKLMGTGCNLKWRDQPGEREILWVTRPGHPIVQGIDDHIVLEKEEMYGEFFDVPEPMETIMISSFAGGEVFRSLCTWTRGAGKIVYFRPGHELFPTFHHPQIQGIIENACRWAAPTPPPTPVRYGLCEEGWLQHPDKGPPSATMPIHAST